MDIDSSDQYKEVEWNEDDKRNLEEIENLIKKDNIGESLRCIRHAINSYLNKALLRVQGIQIGEYKSQKKQKEALKGIYQNSLKASIISKKLKEFYHL